MGVELSGTVTLLRSRPAVELSQLIAHMLCYGVAPDEQAHALLRTDFGFDRGFVQGAVLLLGGKRPVNTAILDAMVRNEQAVELAFKDGVFQLNFEGRAFTCTPLEQPAVLREPGPFGVPWTEYVRMHSPSTVFLTPLRECIFAVRGEICQFCTYKGDRMRAAPLKDMISVLTDLREHLGVPFDVAIGSGTPNLRDHGARYFSRLAESIFSATDAGISVEMVPPHELGDLAILKRSHVDSLIMSIEIWDEAIKRVVCPGKSYVNREHYRAAWRAGTDLFGRGKVSSVLIVGLEPAESTMEGIDTLVSEGVIPTLIPFRPYDDTALASHPLTSADLYTRLSKYNAALLAKHGLSPSMQAACTKCQGCSLDDPMNWFQSADAII